VQDPSGLPFSVEIGFPGPVVVTGVGVNPGPGGSVVVTNDSAPATPPAPVGTPPPPVVPSRPPPRQPRLCWLLTIIATLAVVGLGMAYAAGLFEPWLPRTWWLAVLVVLLLTLVLVLLWTWACAHCGRRRHDGGSGRPRRARRGQRSEPPSSATWSSGTAVTAVTGVGGTAALPAAPPPADGLVGDRITIVSQGLRCGRISFVDAGERQAYAQAQVADAQRAQQAASYAQTAWQILTEEAFLLRRASRYRLGFGLVKVGRDQQTERERHSLEFVTQGSGPADLRPYVLHPSPAREEVPLFGDEEIGVRFIESYVRALWQRAAEASLRLEIRGPSGAAQPGRTTSWRKADSHIDRTGELGYLEAINQIYGTALAGGDLPKDDVLVASADQLPAGAGVLPAGTTFEAVVLAVGPGAPSEPLYRFRFRTGRYQDLTAWTRALSPTATTIPDPGIPAALWAGTGPLSIAEPSLLPLLKEAPPDAPTLRKLDRGAAAPVLVLALPEPLPWQRVRLALRHAGGAGSPSVIRDQHPLPPSGEAVIPLSRYKGATATNGTASPTARLVEDMLGAEPPELALVDDAAQVVGAGTSVPTRTRWLEDGSRAFVVPTDPAERLDDPAGYLLEFRYAHLLPDEHGKRLVDTAIRTITLA
jgi:hypothetical protein